MLDDKIKQTKMVTAFDAIATPCKGILLFV